MFVAPKHFIESTIPVIISMSKTRNTASENNPITVDIPYTKGIKGFVLWVKWMLLKTRPNINRI